MKKYKILLTLTLLSLVTSCIVQNDYLTTSNSITDNTTSNSITSSTTSSDDSTLNITSNLTTSSTTSSAPSSATSSAASSSSKPSSSSSSSNSSSSTIVEPEKLTKTTGLKTIADQYSDSGYSVGLPNAGKQNILVFPVEFPDIKKETMSYTIQDLENAFFGDGTGIEYESLKSYYHKSSYGKVEFDGVITDWYTAKENSTYYTSDEAIEELIDEALNHFNSQLNYADFDTNDDECIDAIYLMHTKPIDYGTDDSFPDAWPYQYFYFDESTVYDNVYPYYYMNCGFGALDYFTESYSATTIIHETGHLFDLPDYYDTDDSTGTSGGLGYADMMDGSYGDHNPLSKMLLGWVDPYVVQHSTTITIDSFESSGDFLLIPKSWNNSMFDEYLIVDLYTPTGLNEFDQEYLFTIPGVRIYHCDAAWGGEYDYFKYDNGSTAHNMLKYIEADGRNDIGASSETSVANSDLYQAGQVFKSSVWANYKWYDNSAMNFTISIDSISNTSATITITYN